MEPDNQFYGMLMKAAGAGGDLDLVLGLQGEMERDGLRPCAVSELGLGSAGSLHSCTAGTVRGGLCLGRLRDGSRAISRR